MDKIRINKFFTEHGICSRREADRLIEAGRVTVNATVAKLDSAAGNADALIAENRPALQSFTNDGLAQLGPTLAELRTLIRDLRRVTDSLDGGPARYILGRDAPKEFEPQ